MLTEIVETLIAGQGFEAKTTRYYTTDGMNCGKLPLNPISAEVSMHLYTRPVWFQIHNEHAPAADELSRLKLLRLSSSEGLCW